MTKINLSMEGETITAGVEGRLTELAGLLLEVMTEDEGFAAIVKAAVAAFEEHTKEVEDE